MAISENGNISGLAWGLLLVDVVLLTLSGYGSYYLRFLHLQVPDFYHLAITSGVLFAALSLIVHDSYASIYTATLKGQCVDLLTRYIVAFGLFMLLLVFLKISERYSRVWLALWTGSSFVLLIGARGVWHLLLKRFRAQGRFTRRVLLLVRNRAMGAREDVVNRELATIQGYDICRRIDLDNPAFAVSQLAAVVAKEKAHEVWISTPLQASGGIGEISYALRHSLVDIKFIPKLDDSQLLKHRMRRLGSLNAIDLSYSPLDGINSAIKRVEDVVLASIIGVLIIPACLLIAIAVKLTSKGPVLFKQIRQGMNGEMIKVYKFRSMEVHDERDGQLTQASKDDPRISALGRFLRRTSLDELPQFYNVIQGRMSIVGPRPHALVHNEYYKDLVESYMWRHKVRPGITGWAQINGYRGETDTLDKMQNRVAHDLWYIDNWSLWLDFKIILCTIYKGFIHPNAY